MNIINRHTLINTSAKMAELSQSKLCKWWIFSRIMACILWSVILKISNYNIYLGIITVPWVLKLVFDVIIVKRVSDAKSFNFYKYTKIINTLKIILTLVVGVVLINSAKADTAGHHCEDDHAFEHAANYISVAMYFLPVVIYNLCMRSAYNHIFGISQKYSEPLPATSNAVNAIKLVVFGIASVSMLSNLFAGYKLAAEFYIVLAARFALFAEAVLKYILLKKVARLDDIIGNM